MYDGAQEILKTISENDRSSVHLLDMSVSFVVMTSPYFSQGWSQRSGKSWVFSQGMDSEVR